MLSAFGPIFEMKRSITIPVLIFAILLGLLAILNAGDFNSFTGEYDGIQPAHAVREHNAGRARERDDKLEWMRAHYVPGHTVILSNGSMVITENSVAYFILNPYWRSTLVVP